MHLNPRKRNREKNQPHVVVQVGFPKSHRADLITALLNLSYKTLSRAVIPTTLRTTVGLAVPAADRSFIAQMNCNFLMGLCWSSSKSKRGLGGFMERCHRIGPSFMVLS